MSKRPSMLRRVVLGIAGAALTCSLALTLSVQTVPPAAVQADGGSSSSSSGGGLTCAQAQQLVAINQSYLSQYQAQLAQAQAALLAAESQRDALTPQINATEALLQRPPCSNYNSDEEVVLYNDLEYTCGNMRLMNTYLHNQYTNWNRVIVQWEDLINMLHILIANTNAALASAQAAVIQLCH